jgi:uncharacterized protein (DUF1501 family)
MHINSHQSRRAFLRFTASMGAAGAAAPLVSSLGFMGEAAAATATDYKAIVCVYLDGGNDYANTLPPYDETSYNLYKAARPGLAHARESLAATALAPANDLGGRQYSLSPALALLKPIFDAGKLAVLLNVGTLVEPTTKAQYEAKAVQLPPKLMSHFDQKSYFQRCSEDAATGWGGRMGDLLQSWNGRSTLTCINATGNAVFVSGTSVQPYAIAPAGPTALLGDSSTLFGSSSAMAALRQIMTTDGQGLLASEHAHVVRRAFDINGTVAAALANAPASTFTQFPRTWNPLADQLKIVARMIAASSDLGARRQVFLVSLGGWDMHDGLPTTHPYLLGLLGQALKAFYDTTVQLGVAEKVTSFTASDFGRSLSGNDDGADHGWGSMHFVMGGAVQGQRIYGTPPAVGDGTNDDIGQGRLIPTIAVDQCAATLATWFGVLPGNLTAVLPNLANFNPSSWNLGFV